MTDIHSNDTRCTRCAPATLATAKHGGCVQLGAPRDHRWDDVGERCLDCGDKDWMGGPCSGPRLEATGTPWVTISTAPNDGRLHIRGLWVTSRIEGKPDTREWRQFIGLINDDGDFVDPDYGESFGWGADQYDAWMPVADAPSATLATVKHGGCVQLGDGLLPCPFCGGRAERIDLGPGSGDNEGGSCVACTGCQSSGPVEFGYKENFISDWNRRALSAQPSPGGQGAPFPWENFPAYLIDKCEGDTISEEGLQQALAAMATDERYCIAARQPVAPTLQQISDYLHGLGEIKRAVIEREALAARQPVGEPVAWMTHHDEPMLFPTAAEAAAYCEDDEQPAPLFRSPAQAVDLERARNEGHDGAIRYVLGYLCGMGDWGSTQYVEILNGCGRESIIRSAIEDGELEFTGLGRWVEERGTDEERALIASQAVGND
ncbi:Lar family restriction alleviation protein [Stenotrophomonas lactitubi]|uniref:Lar family restriction alleviation protein n=1 Tax=Stenotrophomonas lactitubi TaxID=2045214 RepID=UPI00333E4DCC